MRRLLAIVLLLIAASATKVIAAVPSLDRVLLEPKQVGDGYLMRKFEQGDVVKNQVSLDLCGFIFPSERLRTARLQVAYLHSGGVTQLSNEVVSYRGRGARQAVTELRQAVTRCPRRPVRGPVRGTVPIAHRLTRITDARLLKPYIAVVDRNTASINGKRVVKWSVSVYQIRRNVLSAIYTDGTGSVPAQRRIALHAASESAKNLREAIR
jgi:hypothetical protein